MKYFVLIKSTGSKTEIKPNRIAEFFGLVRNVTGLDRAIAEAILNSGKPIDHPEYRFTAKGRA
jgi:hypothetical protein